MGAFDDTIKLVMDAEHRRFIKARQELISTLAKKAPVRTGDTRDFTGAERFSESGTVWSFDAVSKTKQAKLTDEGTGLFGPRGALIVPTRGKVTNKHGNLVDAALRWIDNNGQTIFAKSSRGSGKHKGWFSDTVKDWPNVLDGV